MNSAGFNLGTGFNTSAPKGSTVTNILFYTLVIVFIAIVVLVIMHFTYKPIFGPGSVLSGTTGKVYWEDERSSTHEDVSSNLTNKCHDFSICFDIIVDNTFRSTSESTNILLHTVRDTPNNTNVRFFMDISKNDLTFEVGTRQRNAGNTNEDGLSSIVFTNVPIRKEFTIGFVLTQKFMEAYINGSLYKTKTFAPAVLKPNDSANLVFRDALKGTNGGGVRIKRLQLWKEIVGPDVMRAYGGSVSPSFEKNPDTDTDTCG